jgi:hypothetical protein
MVRQVSPLYRALFSLLCAALMVLGLMPSGTAPASAAESPCANVLFYGARGSGQTLTDGNAKSTDPWYGMGREVARVYREWRATVPNGVTVATSYNSYEAASVDYLKPSRRVLAEVANPLFQPLALKDYWYGTNNKTGAAKFVASVNNGVTSASDYLASMHARCPDMKFVLAGYSQGAMVMHQVGRELATSGVVAQIATSNAIIGTFLVADGDRDDHTAASHFGTSSNTASGVRTYYKHTLNLPDAPETPPAADVLDPALTADICDADDIVCDHNWTSLPQYSEATQTHGGYRDPNNPAISSAVTALGHKIAERTPTTPTWM